MTQLPFFGHLKLRGRGTFLWKDCFAFQVVLQKATKLVEELGEIIAKFKCSTALSGAKAV
jgi:hypothetical protein